MRGECEVLFGRWEALLAVEEEISNRLLLIWNQSSGKWSEFETEIWNFQI